MLYYEDHCKDAKTFTQSKDYIAKILPRIFPSVNRICIYRNSMSYAGFSGIRKVDIASVILSESVSPTIHHDGRGNIEIAVPSFYQRNEKQLYVVTTLNGGEIDMGLSDGTTFERIDGKLLDIPACSTVTRPIKAIIQLSKSIRLCRGVETGEETVERWTSLIDTTIQLRVRAPACQHVVTWLSNGGVCGACKRLSKKHKTADNQGVESNATDDDLLKAVIQRATSQGGCTQTTAIALLKSQRDNTNPKKDPRFRRWSHEVITLCLTLFCR